MKPKPAPQLRAVSRSFSLQYNLLESLEDEAELNKIDASKMLGRILKAHYKLE